MRPLLLCFALAPLGSLPAQTPGDTAQYVILFSDRPAGFYREWSANGELHSVYEYNDRGRGPHQEAVLREAADDFPAAFSIAGHNYVKDTVDETLTSASGTLTWSNRFEHGSAPADTHGFYVAASETPTGLRQLVQAGLKRGGPVTLLPSGGATVETAASITIRARNHDVHLTMYAVGGIGFSPQPVWLTDDGQNPLHHISDIRRTTLVVKNGLIYWPLELYGALGVQP